MAFSPDSGDVLLEGDNIHSYNVDEEVLRGQVVKIGSANSVEPTDTDGEVTHGVALQTVSTGDQVAVAGPGCVVNVQAGTADVSAGDVLTSHGGTGDEGQVDTGDATGDSIIGYADTGSSAQGDLVEMEVDRGGEVN
jgi:hypothetical protein